MYGDTLSQKRSKCLNIVDPDRLAMKKEVILRQSESIPIGITLNQRQTNFQKATEELIHQVTTFLFYQDFMSVFLNTEIKIFQFSQRIVWKLTELT